MITKLYQQIFLLGINLTYLLYILVVIGITRYAPEYLEGLKTFLKIYVGFILVILYNPITYKEIKFTDFHRKLVFSSGVFLLLSSTLISGIEIYIQENIKTLYSNIANF